MQEFRILGPLEVRGEQGPIALGGPRQRALLAALLLRAGRVVPTEQLVDELYGAEPPPTATASLQNAVVALRKALGPDVLVTRTPGYVLAVSRATRSTRGASSSCSPTRGRASPEERRALLVRALDLWRGPALAEFAFEDWAQPETRRLEELRLVALEERIATDIELGRPADVVPELESLVRRASAARAPGSSLMLALHAAGRRRRRSSALPTRTAALDELGLEPGEDLRRLQGEILRRRGGAARSNGHGGAHDADAEVVKALVSGRVVPVLGLDGGDRPRRAARPAFGYPSRPSARPRPRLAVRRDDERLGPALRRATPPLRGGGRAAARAPLPGRACAAAPRARRAAPADHLDAVRPRARARVRGRRARRSTS